MYPRRGPRDGRRKLRGELSTVSSKEDSDFGDIDTEGLKGSVSGLAVMILTGSIVYIVDAVVFVVGDITLDELGATDDPSAFTDRVCEPP